MNKKELLTWLIISLAVFGVFILLGYEFQQAIEHARTR